ncbi:hypothetical protein BD410DRAFT_768992 [Rickenella mellea]|uniref:tRNA-splicing endonuclease subunit Sen54 N-terminal domain-containing protein n=1 Tax=Rickenella mellea TaxID=50990 RepID=A0A4Y7Q7I3_9AGAM|nr:hypothetical protein BD410DRAFT_768992 [Rickenella mellea]
MDESLELPSLTPKIPQPTDSTEGADEQSSGEEDGGPDWTKIPSGSSKFSVRPVIPKRGEKDFEPSEGSALQQHMLGQMRSAMFDALNVPRTASNKSISYAIWIPHLRRAHVTVARGTLFNGMGHSVPRPLSPGEDDSLGEEKLHKRLELLPEETLYLIERGSMFCWMEGDVPTNIGPAWEDVAGFPISVQQAYAEMIGKDDLTLEKYQIYAYLKRLGYVVTRARPPTPFYPTPAPYIPKRSMFNWLLRFWGKIFTGIYALFSRKRNWWRPLHLGGWWDKHTNYASIFSSLRFLPAGHSRPLMPHKSTQLGTTGDTTTITSPYTIFYNLYKPSTPFRKTAPPPPDFSLVVVGARKTPMPSLLELTSLFDLLPEEPLPPPRQRHPTQSKPLPVPPVPAPTTSSVQTSTLTLGFSRLSRWIYPNWFRNGDAKVQPAVRKINPFQALKFGKKNIVIAVVDAGTTNFYRFGEGAFEEWPMV